MFEWLSQLFTVRTFPPPTFWDYLFSWILFSIIVVIILVISALILFIIKKVIVRKKISLNLYNGIKIIFRLALIVFIVILFTSASASLIPGGLPPEVAIIISAITGSIIAFSTTTILQNFIAGLYILFTRPYRIGDLIQIGDQEGIVDGVTLNYTKLRRPSGAVHLVSNSSIINSEIINFTITKDMLKDYKEEKLKDIFFKKEITRYWFTLDLPKKNPEKTIKKLDEICEKYEKLLNYPPEYYVSDLLAHIRMDFVLLTDDPNLIFIHKKEFIKDVYLQIFGSEEGFKMQNFTSGQ